MRRTNLNRLAAALAVCTAAFAANKAQAAPLVFTIDSSVSYVQLAIPNFSYSGNTITIHGQNRTNGAALSTAWSTTTGNQAFISGTVSSNVEGSFTGQTVSAIAFIGGANNIRALTSGNYRPNFAAYNTLTSNYNNNGAAPANFGAAAASTLLGNAAVISFSNTTLDMNTSAGLPASVTVGSGTFNSDAGNLQVGILSANLAIEGLSLFLVGQVIPNGGGTLGPLLSNNTSAGGVYTYTSPTNLRLTIPISIPFSIDTGGGVFINGTISGREVLNAAVPEPSTLALVGMGLVSLVALARRRRNRLANA